MFFCRKSFGGTAILIVFLFSDLGKKEEQIDELTKQLETKKNECQEFKMVAAMNHVSIYLTFI